MRVFKKIIRKILGGPEYLGIQLDITNACNLRCTHCYHSHHNNSGALTLEQWHEVIDQYEKLLNKLDLLPDITICGGEPLISPLFQPIVNRINSKWSNAPIGVLTNGTCFNEEILSFLSANNIAIQVSLDGPGQQSHDLIRGTGNFARTIEGVKNAINTYGLDIHLLAVLSKRSSHHISEFFQLATSLGASSMNFTRLISQGYGEKLVKNGNDDVLIKSELKKVYEDIINSSKQYKVYTNANKPLFHLIDSKYSVKTKIGFEGFVVDYKGNIKVSSRASYILGNVFRENMEDIFLHHPLMKKLRNKDKIDKCGNCEFYKKCGGDRNASFAQFGTFLKTDPGCWI